MKIESLDLPDEVKQFYLDSGILELYPPQAEAVEKGLLEETCLLRSLRLQGRLSLQSLQC